MAAIHQPGGIHALLDFTGINIALFHQIAADGFAQDQRIGTGKHIICQLIKVRVLERPDAVADHIDRLVGHKGAERIFEVGQAVEIDIVRSAYLDDRVVVFQELGEAVEFRGDAKITQAAFASDFRQ